MVYGFDSKLISSTVALEKSNEPECLKLPMI